MALKEMKALKSRMDDLKKQIETEAKAAFSATAKEIFEKYPTLEQVSWHQYTPYFNDGDECTFSAYVDDDSLALNGKEYYDDDYPKDLAKAAKEFSALLGAIGEDYLKAMFGDHVEVTAKRDGKVIVEEFSHD